MSRMSSIGLSVTLGCAVRANYIKTIKVLCKRLNLKYVIIRTKWNLLTSAYNIEVDGDVKSVNAFQRFVNMYL